VSYVHAGFTKGKLSLEYTDMVYPLAVLEFHPEIKAQLDEISQQGWTYLFIESRAKSVSDFEIDQSYRLLEDGVGYYVQLYLGDHPPAITGMPEVTEFRINICTKSFPRAVTLDLSKNMITYIHEAFWEWEEAWKDDPAKLAQATEVYEVARWVLEVKKMKLHEELKMDHYTALSKLFAAPPTTIPPKEEPVK
jgi:hypothetical protein